MNVLVAGAGGALGGHLVKRLLEEGSHVRAVDRKPFTDWWQLHDTENLQLDLSIQGACEWVVKGQDYVYNLAADMGGIGYIETHRADCMFSVLINTHLIQAAALKSNVERYWYASSACIYPAGAQNSPEAGYELLKEEDAYPAQPEAGYGEEKLFAEQMCRYVGQDYEMDVRIARLHNVYGPHSTWRGGREKAPAALCRKVAEAQLSGKHEIEVWGDGTLTRSFLYVDDFVTGAVKIMECDYSDPINLGSDEVVTVDELLRTIEYVAGVGVKRKWNLDAPQGVQGRGSDNDLIAQVTGWVPTIKLEEGIRHLYPWVQERVRSRRY